MQIRISYEFDPTITPPFVCWIHLIEGESTRRLFCVVRESYEEARDAALLRAEALVAKSRITKPAEEVIDL